MAWAVVPTWMTPVRRVVAESTATAASFRFTYRSFRETACARSRRVPGCRGWHLRGGTGADVLLRAVHGGHR
ncbi:hypothetical protein GCM10009639_67980 [Kitasatospora putterlickiae]|uniref:Secreted protein n=1 Tax=Kitasatospora putterlickiae TaxID=221725 RepID=A0ABN1YI02_9ACTN